MLDSVKGLEELAAVGSRGEGSAEGWTAVSAKAKTIADALRTGAYLSCCGARCSFSGGLALTERTLLEELRIALGETSLLESCSTLLRLSLVAGQASLAGRTELLRVVGNMCFDNSESRVLCCSLGPR